MRSSDMVQDMLADQNETLRFPLLPRSSLRQQHLHARYTDFHRFRCCHHIQAGNAFSSRARRLRPSRYKNTRPPFGAGMFSEDPSCDHCTWNVYLLTMHYYHLQI